LPAVAPRVVVEGTAGNYFISEIIRGQVEFEDPVLDSPYTIGNDTKAILDPANPQRAIVPVQDAIYLKAKSYLGLYSTSGQVELSLSSPSGMFRWMVKLDALTASISTEWHQVPHSYMSHGYHDNANTTDNVPALWMLVNANGSGDQTGLRESYWVYFWLNYRRDTAFVEAVDPNAVVSIEARGNSITRYVNDPLYVGLIEPPTLFGPELAPNDGTNDNIIHGHEFAPTEPNFQGSMGHFPEIVANTIALKESLSGGGSITLSSSGYLKWTQRIIAMTARNSYQNSGNLDINMPPVGFSIPVIGQSSQIATYVDVTADGIPMTTWGGLYYRIPWGKVDGATRYENFYIVRYQGNFNIPDDWICIARRNIDVLSSDIVMGWGREVSAWRTFTPTAWNGYQHHPTLPAQYKKENGQVYLRGAIRNASSTVTMANPNGPDGLLDAGFRPKQTWVGGATFAPNSGTANDWVRLDINGAGDFTVRFATPPLGQIFFDGLNLTAF